MTQEEIAKRLEKIGEGLKEITEQLEKIEDTETKEHYEDLDELFEDWEMWDDSSESTRGPGGAFVEGFGTVDFNDGIALKNRFRSKKECEVQEDENVFDMIESQRKYGCTGDCDNCEYENGCEHSIKDLETITLDDERYEQLEKFNDALNTYYNSPFNSKYGKMKIAKEFIDFARLYDEKEKVYRKTILTLGTIIGLGTVTTIIKGLTSKKS